MILVTGATGLNGGELAHRLSARDLPARALVRDRAKANSIAALSNVEIMRGDMARPESLIPALQGVDRAFLNSSAAPGMLRDQKRNPLRQRLCRRCQQIPACGWSSPLHRKGSGRTVCREAEGQRSASIAHGARDSRPTADPLRGVCKTQRCNLPRRTTSSKNLTSI
jgi:hypothetical protein